MQRFAWSLAWSLGILAGMPILGYADWEADFESAQSESEISQRPLLIHFYADWCGPCQQMEETVLNADEVIAACGAECVAVKVNFDHHKDLAQKYGVAALPTDVMIDPQGEVLDRYVGKSSVDEYVARMDRAVEKCESCAAGRIDDDTTRDVLGLLTQLAATGGVGLEGYSPVALTTDRVWTKGSAEYAWRHAGVMYHMADAGELETFKSDPEKYAPRYCGFDPLILSTDGVAVPGLIVYGSFYKEHLHLHATAESRKVFLEDPARYPAPTQMEVPESLVQKEPVVAQIPAG